jgi:ribosomal protein S18 acetylase RimI-like enzyme
MGMKKLSGYKGHLYCVSQEDLDSKTLTPRVPNNFFTKNGYEDKTTKRVCFAPSIDKCLMGLSQNLKGKEFNVYEPDGKYEVYKPDKDSVPDSTVTGELWILKPVKVKKVKKIKVIEDTGEDGIPFYYGDNKAKLYKWKYEAMNESAVLESKAKDHFYFYHLVPKCSDMSKGITSLEYQYQHNKKEFRKNSNKYRYRLCNGWGIYPGRDPESLSDDEIYDGINKFRRSSDGCNKIYMFRYPPYEKLGKEMKRTLKGKDIYRVDINELRDAKIITDIDFGYVDSNTDNDRLTEDWYRNISHDDYFKNYTESDPERLMFSYMNHIGVTTMNGVIPKKYITKVSDPESITEAGLKSTIDKDFKAKGKKSLNDFKRVKISNSTIQQYKSSTKLLRYIDPKDTAYLYLDKDNIVAVVAVESSDRDDGTRWITAIEVIKEYQGYGLGKQLLDVAVKELKGNSLSVAKNNDVAKRMYENYGFKTSKASEDDVNAGRKSVYFMYIGRAMQEACKDLDTARQFVRDVGELAKKYDANYYIVTDGASGTNNRGNPAVKHARDTMKKWESKHGFDPDEDWSKNESALLESSSKISFSDKKSDASAVLESLSKKDVYMFLGGEEPRKSFPKDFMDCKFAYLETVIDGKTPAASIWVRDRYTPEGKRYGYISIACNPKFRGKGYPTMLCQRLFEAKAFDVYRWNADVNNKASGSLAKKLGFEEKEIMYTKESATVYVMEMSRKDMSPDEFGVPGKKKFPLDSEAHVKSAIKFFNYVEPDDEAELAKRIKKKAKEYGVVIRCGEKNRLSKYITEEYIKEFMAAGAIGNNAYAVTNGAIKQAAYQNGYEYSVTDHYPYTKKKKMHKNNMQGEEINKG